MSAPPPSVSVFHFTSTISKAKIAKYKMATERGMAPPLPSPPTDGQAAVHRNGAPPSSSTEDTELLPTDEPPPAKKPRLKLHVRTPRNEEESVAVNTRSKRRIVPQSRPSQDMATIPDGRVQAPDEVQSVESSTPSSVLSSLSSAPSSAVQESREEWPFKDPTPPPSATDPAYGDFMNYYIAGGNERNEEPEDEAQKPASTRTKRKRVLTMKAAEKPKPLPKPRATRNAKNANELKESTNSEGSTVPPAPSPEVQLQPPPQQEQQQPQQHQQQQQQQQQQQEEQVPQQPQRHQIPLRPSRPQRQHHPLPSNFQPPPPPQNGPISHNAAPPYPRGPPPGASRPPPYQAQPPPPPPPPPMATPIIQFLDIVHDPKPDTPDTVATMIHKLEALSTALTQFGGVPAAPQTPPPPQRAQFPKAVKPLKPLKVDDPKNAPLNAIDGFLSFFGDDSGDESEENEERENKTEERDLNFVLKNGASIDGPLCYGIQFIQNALKSWAQQRMTHQITQQLQTQQDQILGEHQQRRGPGRPRKVEEPLPGQPGGPPPVIQMNLADTPEGVAIKSFQSTLDAACLQVNGLLPSELSRALRHLYTQIDHLINQGANNEKLPWGCMSYGAQILAHKALVTGWKEQQALAQQERARQQAIQQQHAMAPMGLHSHTVPMTNEEAQRAHALELERRRSMQHAQQQPYISQQHLHPLQLGSQTPGTPTGACPSSSPTPFPAGANAPPMGHMAGSSVPSPGVPPAPSTTKETGAGRVQLDGMKMYVPGFLPRSGQSMKFSFAPQNDAAVQIFGTEAFPKRPGPGAGQMPNRGPMGGTLAPRMTNFPADTAMPDARSLAPNNSKETAIDLTQSDGPDMMEGRAHPVASSGSSGSGNLATHPMAGAEGRSSVPTPTLTTNGVATESHMASSGSRRGRRGGAARNPHAGAVVIDG